VSGAALEDAELWLQRRGVAYVLKIASVEKVRMWAQLGPNRRPPEPEIEAYRMEWSDVNGSVPAGQWRNVCADAMLPVHSIELRGVSNDLTFVFEGERIDPRRKTIYDFDVHWFNLGCAGHTLMKMYLMGTSEPHRSATRRRWMSDRRS
jgi:hypothetical protein